MQYNLTAKENMFIKILFGELYCGQFWFGGANSSWAVVREVAQYYDRRLWHKATHREVGNINARRIYENTFVSNWSNAQRIRLYWLSIYRSAFENAYEACLYMHSPRCRLDFIGTLWSLRVRGRWHAWQPWRPQTKYATNVKPFLSWTKLWIKSEKNIFFFDVYWLFQ